MMGITVMMMDAAGCARLKVDGIALMMGKMDKYLIGAGLLADLN